MALWELKRAHIEYDSRRVDTVGEYRRALEEFHPDVILSDFSMPQFDGMEALRIAKQSYPHIPFIFVSGTIGEESAVLALKNGAKDYVLKGNLLRLAPAIQRAVRETEERRLRQANDNELRVNERFYRSLFQGNPDPMVVYDIATLKVLAANDAAQRSLGYRRETFLEMTVNDILVEQDVRRLLGYSVQSSATGTEMGSWHWQKKSGELLETQMAFYDIILKDGPARIMVLQRNEQD